MDRVNLKIVFRMMRGKRVETVNLSFNRWVTLRYFLYLLATIEKNWPGIDWSSKREAGDILGSVQWGRFKKKTHPLIGRCLSHMVKLDLLPQRLQLARKPNGEPYRGGRLHYVLAGSQAAVALPVISARSVKRTGSIDPRTLRVYPSNPASVTIGKEVTLQ
jgi:hypothetical protein